MPERLWNRKGNIESAACAIGQASRSSTAIREFDTGAICRIMADMTQGSNANKQAGHWTRERSARDAVCIRFGFAALAVVAVGCAVWFVVWRARAGPLTKALVEVRMHGIEAPESRLTYPLDGAPILEEQWGRGQAPASPFADPRALDFLVVKETGPPILFTAAEGDHRDLVIVAGKRVAWSVIAKGLAAKDRRLWLATKTPAVVGRPGEEIRLEPEEMSELGVVPVALCDGGESAPDGPRPSKTCSIAGDPSLEELVRIVEGLYLDGARECALRVEGGNPPVPPAAK